MPPWKIHRKWGEKLLGFSNSEIDKLIDNSENHDAGQWDEGVLEIQLSYVRSKYGFMGEQYYVLHHILDRAEQLLLSIVSNHLDAYTPVFEERAIIDTLQKWAELLYSELLIDTRSIVIKKQYGNTIISQLCGCELIYELICDILTNEKFHDGLVNTAEMKLASYIHRVFRRGPVVVGIGEEARREYERRKREKEQLTEKEIEKWRTKFEWFFKVIETLTELDYCGHR